jgi:hypothetical protein
MALRVQGISGAERASAALGTSPEDAGRRLSALVDSGLATERTGRLAGFTLSPVGMTTLDELLADEGLRSSTDLKDCYERFMQLNPRVLKVSSDWQVRREGGIDTPNDHTDAAYDEEVIERLCSLHSRTCTCMAMITEAAPRFGTYGPRFDACVERLRSGDHSAFTAPLAESYHTVWFELHQDLLLTLGLEREE